MKKHETLEPAQPDNLTLLEWLQEREDNARRFAKIRTGDDRLGWLEDASYFQQAIDAIQRPAVTRGAYARCGYCNRYSDDPNTVGDNPQPLCDCGEQYGWSGSFVAPNAHSEWSGSPAKPPAPHQPDTAAIYKVLIEARTALLAINCSPQCRSHATVRLISLIDTVINAPPSSSPQERNRTA